MMTKRRHHVPLQGGIIKRTKNNLTAAAGGGGYREQLPNLGRGDEGGDCPETREEGEKRSHQLLLAHPSMRREEEGL